MTTKTGKKNKSTLRITEGSSNVFADIGLANPEQELLKARLTLQIYRTIKGRKLTQVQAGEVLGIKQPHVSSLMRGQSGAFSVERLMDFLTALGHDIEIAVTPSRKEHGKMSVSVAERVPT
ncbi:MAG: helix-turn-helix domain-containing protein [Acidobacteriia bacterium]|nr:helix-turn-helix domain-containing protein [Terriglobia bacterium]